VINVGDQGQSSRDGYGEEWPAEVVNLEPEANTVFGTNPPWL
jgi:hypothetical protein